MFLEAADTVLGYFFDRILYGDTQKNKNRKWWHHVREDYRKDVETERNIQGHAK
jgi:hypothetical protein